MSVDYDGFKILNVEESSAVPGLPNGLKIGTTLPNGELWQGVNILPIPYTREMAEYVRYEVCAMLSSPDPLVYLVSTESTDSVRAEIKRFGLALYAYLNTPEVVLTFALLTEGILDYNFAAYLKKLRAKAILNRSGGLHDQDPGQEFEDLPTYMIWDVGDIFNYKYWFNWKLEPEGDIEFTHLPLSTVEESLGRFKASVRKLVKEVLKKGKVPIVTEEAIASTLSSSSCIDNNGKRSKVWKEKEKSNGFSSSPLRGQITYVQKGPCELREAITLSVEQSNSVRLIEKQVYYVIRNMRHSAYNSDPEIFEQRLKRFYDDNNSFFNRDLTKEGLTKPRILLSIMLKVLSEEIPNAPAWKYAGIYDNFYYTDSKGVEHSTERGHGLGMANALTTLMQIAAFDSFLETIDVDSSKIDALFFNDDGSIGAEDSEIIGTYQDEEADYLRTLGLIPKGTKTWNGRVCVLCERYYPDMLNSKQSYKNYARVLPFSASCILVAKGMSNLTIDPSYGEPRWDLYERLVQFFGTETGNLDEVTTPYSSGGWLNIKYAGVDCSYLDYEGGHPPEFVSQGAHVGPPRLKPLTFSKEKGLYKSPLEKQYEMPPLPEAVESRILVRKSRAEVAALFSRNTDEYRLTVWLKAELDRRKIEWFKKNPYLSWRELIEKVNERSDFDVLPPKKFIHEKDANEVSVEGSGRFESHDPILSLRWFYSSELPTVVRTVPWPVYDPGQGADVISSKIAQSESKNMFLPKGHPILNKAPFVNDRVLTNRCWKDSYKVWKIWIALYGNPSFPVNPWPVGIAALHKEFEIYETHIEKFWTWYNEIESLGFKLILTLLRNPELVDILMEPPEREEEEHIVASSEAYEYESFDQWYYSGTPVVDHPFYHIWVQGQQVLTISEASTNAAEINGDIRRQGRNWPSASFRSEGEKAVIMHFCRLIEAEHKYGFATYHLGSHDLMDDSDEGGVFGFFDEG